VHGRQVDPARIGADLKFALGITPCAGHQRFPAAGTGDGDSL
jgi:hypothetical protein